MRRCGAHDETTPARGPASLSQRGSGLLLQRLAQLIEQAGVLDRDNRLDGEV
jgi:hypothetical protein